MDTKNDNKDVQILKEELWTRRTVVKVTMLKRTMTMDDLDILKEIQKNNTKEKEVKQALKKEDGLSWEQDRIVYIEGQIYIPNNKKLKEKILQENHDLADIGHLEQQRMIKLLK